MLLCNTITANIRVLRLYTVNGLILGNINGDFTYARAIIKLQSLAVGVTLCHYGTSFLPQLIITDFMTMHSKKGRR